MARPSDKTDLLQGTLDLLILQVAALGPVHGYAIAQRLNQISKEALQVQQGSLYPALQRMLIKGWVTAEWGVTAGNRRARYYKPTKAGRKQLEIELSQFQRVNQAIIRVTQTA